MSGEISVVGWESANSIAQHLTKNGYQVKIEADAELAITNEIRFIISFVHPVFEGKSFELFDQEFEGTRTWEDIKSELGDGLEHLDDQPVWTVARGDTDGDQPVKKKVKK